MDKINEKGISFNFEIVDIIAELKFKFCPSNTFVSRVTDVIRPPAINAFNFLLLFVHKKKALSFLPYPIIRIIFPGFMMFFGSSACLIARIAAISTGEE